MNQTTTTPRWRAWPTWGMATFLVLEILLVPVVGPVAALWISSGVFFGGGALAMATTAPYRGGVRTMVAVRRSGVADAPAAERFVEFYVLAHQLVEADQALAAGEIRTGRPRTGGVARLRPDGWHRARARLVRGAPRARARAR